MNNYKFSGIKRALPGTDYVDQVDDDHIGQKSGNDLNMVLMKRVKLQLQSQLSTQEQNLTSIP